MLWNGGDAMKPKGQNEIEIRTPEKNLLVCTVSPTPDGTLEIISRHGKQEDRMRMETFLAKVFSKDR